MTAWPDGVDRVVLERVDSTSAEAARRAPSVPTWFLAQEQTAGHGRRGRTWSMPKGNFAGSLALRPPGGPAEYALRSFIASLALHDALTGMGVAGLSLKWPNDVLLEDRKLAGILLESPKADLLVLGIGINLIAAPDATEIEPGALAAVSLLEATGLRITSEAMLDALAPAFAARETQFQTYGFDPIRRAWLDYAARLGTPITARLMSETVTGIFETVDPAGHLVLRTGAGQRSLPAADVYFGEAPCS